MSQEWKGKPGAVTSGKGASHSVHIERRRHTIITGVMDVCSFHETEVVLKVEEGVMVLSGQDFHIGKLLLDDGRLDVEGHIDSIAYELPKVGVRHWLPWRKLEK